MIRENLKEFNNGNIVLRLDDVFEDFEKLYHNVLECNDFYICQIKGYLYLVNNRTERAYDLSEYGYSVPVLFEKMNEVLKNNDSLKLYPYGKKDSKSLLNDLSNGY